jgi:hypothetical protein
MGGCESGPSSSLLNLTIMIAALLSAAGAQALEIPPPPLSGTAPVEIRIVSTEFRYAPARLWVTAGRAVTLIFDIEIKSALILQPVPAALTDGLDAILAALGHRN